MEIVSKPFLMLLAILLCFSTLQVKSFLSILLRVVSGSNNKEAKLTFRVLYNCLRATGSFGVEEVLRLSH